MNLQDNKLSRFLEAQNSTYESALKEIRNGRKTGHWMWFIFPQLAGLGFSETAKFYAIQNKAEATDYLKDNRLGSRLREISGELLKLPVSNAVNIFGEIDSIKLRSCMTLFSLVEDTHPVFEEVLIKFFNGEKDKKTLLLLSN